MKCLCWHLTKGLCPEPNEVLDTKVRSKSAALVPTVGYTMVLSRLYLAPKSWWVVLRTKAQSERTSSSRAAWTGQSEFYFLSHKPGTEVISTCAPFSKRRHFLKVTFCNHRISGWKKSWRSHIAASCFFSLETLPRYSCQVVLEQRWGTHHLMRKLIPYSYGSNSSTVLSLAEIKPFSWKSHLLLLMLPFGAPRSRWVSGKSSLI